MTDWLLVLLTAAIACFRVQTWRTNQRIEQLYEKLNCITGAIVFPLRRSLLSLGLISLFLVGCTIHGPDAMRASRIAYNEAVQASDQRELLLNLVRLRYIEAPEFLAISGISTQMNFTANASIGGEFGEADGENLAFISPGASVGYSESPTMTFVPRRDQEFTRQLVAPVELDSIYLLTRYGWGLDRVLLLIVDELNGVRNTISRESTSAGETDLRTFQELAARMRRLEAENLIRVNIQHRNEVLSAPIPDELVSAEDVLSAVKDGYRLEYQKESASYVLAKEQAHYILAVSRNAWDHPDFEAVSSTLNLPPRQEVYEIDPTGTSDTKGLRLTTRSVLGTMAYLSNAVSIPDEHDGLVDPAVDLNTPSKSLMKIRVAATPVDNAYVAVEHHGYWFYVDDDDIESKRTLGLLTSLVRLSISAGGAQNVPILTLPVSR